jgi:hypothetical protein
VCGSQSPQTPTAPHVCSACGLELEPASQFCGSCGAAVGVAAAAGMTSTRPREFASIEPAGLSPTPSDHGAQSEHGSLRWLLVAVAGVVIVAALVLGVAYVAGWVGGDDTGADVAHSGSGGSSAPAASPKPSASPSVAPSAEPAPEPSPEPSSEPPSSPETPFWGAFYCASHNHDKAEQTAEVGRQAGFSTLVLWTDDYSSIGRPDDPVWVICAGPFASKSEAEEAVRRMRAEATELEALAPKLKIPFGGAYAKEVW